MVVLQSLTLKKIILSILNKKTILLDQTIVIDETNADIPPNIDLSQTLGNIIKLHEIHVDMRLPTELDRTGLFEDVESELKDKWTYNDLMAKISIGIEDPDERKRFEDLIFEYREIFSSVDFTKGKNLPEFHIELLNNVPIFSPQIRTSPATNLEILKITDDLEKKGIITKSNSDYNIPALFVRRRPTPDTTGNKPVSALRMILDLRQIGEHSIKHKWQITPMEETLKKLSNFKHYLSLKLINYNFQVPLSKESTNILAFTAGAGRFQLNRLPFGYINTHTAFHSSITKVLGNLLEPISLPVTTFKNGISNVKMIDKTRIAFQGDNLIIAAEDHNNLISLLSKGIQ